MSVIFILLLKILIPEDSYTIIFKVIILTKFVKKSKLITSISKYIIEKNEFKIDIWLKIIDKQWTIVAFAITETILISSWDS